MYPATLGVAPEVIRLATVENPWARWTALQIMIDWVTSFDAEPGFEMVQLADGASVELQPTVRSLVAAATPALRSQLQTERAAPVRAALRELLDAAG